MFSSFVQIVSQRLKLLRIGSIRIEYAQVQAGKDGENLPVINSPQCFNLLPVAHSCGHINKLYVISLKSVSILSLQSSEAS